MDGEVRLELTTLKHLIVALAMTLEVYPEAIVATWHDVEACQEFYEKVVGLIREEKDGK